MYLLGAYSDTWVEKDTLRKKDTPSTTVPGQLSHNFVDNELCLQWWLYNWGEGGKKAVAKAYC